MARLVRIPQGYGKAFTYKSPGKLKVESTDKSTKMTGADVMQFLQFAEKVGKSETINALAGQFLDDDGTEEAVVEEAKVTEKPAQPTPAAPMQAAPKPQTAPPVTPPAGVERAPAAVPSPPPAQGQRRPSAPIERAARARAETKLPEPIKVTLTQPPPQIQPQAALPAIPSPPVFSPTDQSPEAYVVAFSEITENFAAPQNVGNERSAAERQRNLQQRAHNRAVRNSLIQGLASLSPKQLKKWAKNALEVEGDKPAKAQLIRNAVIGAAQLREQQKRGNLGTQTIKPQGPAAPRTPQGAPPVAERQPPPEQTRGAAADASRPARSVPVAGGKQARKLIREGAAVGAAGVTRDMTTTAPKAAAEPVSVQGFMDKYQLGRRRPTAAAQQGVAPAGMTYEAFMAQRAAPKLTIPEKVSFRQLQALAKMAATPQQKADILMAYGRASGKSKPRSLVERYSRAHEQRDIDKLNTLFPRRAPKTAQEEYYKYARGERERAAAQREMQKAKLLQQQANLTARKEQELRRKLDAGAPEIASGYKLALMQQALQGAQLSAERATRIRELVDAERHKIDSIALKNLAEVYKKTRAGMGGKGKGRKKKVLTPNQELLARERAVDRSLSDYDKKIARVRKKLEMKGALQTEIDALQTAAAAAGPTENKSAYFTRIAKLEGIKARMATDPEALQSTLNTLERQRRLVVAQRNTQTQEVIGREQRPAQVVPPTEAKPQLQRTTPQ